MYRAVFFDMDGLVLDTEKHYKKAWIQAANEMGHKMTAKEHLFLRSCSKKYAEPIMQSIFGKGFDYSAVRARRKEIMAEDLKHIEIEKKPHVDEILKYLKENNIKSALVTATEEIRAREYLSRVGLEESFDKIICADMVKNGKPDPDVYIFACEKIGEAKENCLALEDSPNGVLSASRAGIDVIMIPDLSEPEEETKKLILKRAENLGEVIEFLNEKLHLIS